MKNVDFLAGGVSYAKGGGDRAWDYITLGHRLGGWVIHFPAVVCTSSPSTARAYDSLCCFSALAHAPDKAAANQQRLNDVGVGADGPKFAAMPL